MKRIFLSYSRKDASQAKDCYHALKCLPGIDVWFDLENLLPGTSWRPAIRKAIRESDFFIALLSTNSVSGKGFCNSELQQAIEVKNEFPENHIFLIPVRLDECEIPYQELTEITYADLFPDWDKGIEKIKKAIGVQSCDEMTSLYSDNSSHNRQKDQRSVLDYEYRIGLADLDSGLTNLRQLAEELNQVQPYFHFTLFDLHCSNDAISNFNGSINLDLYRLPSAFYGESRYFNFDQVICLTKYFLAYRQNNQVYYNYLGRTSQYDERFLFLSLGGLYQYSQKAGIKYEIAIVLLIVSKLADYFMEINYHKELRACPMDFTKTHDTIVPGLTKGKFCKQCESILSQNSQIYKALVSMLEWGRNGIV